MASVRSADFLFYLNVCVLRVLLVDLGILSTLTTPLSFVNVVAMLGFFRARFTSRSFQYLIFYF